MINNTENKKNTETLLFNYLDLQTVTCFLFNQLYHYLGDKIKTQLTI